MEINFVSTTKFIYKKGWEKGFSNETKNNKKNGDHTNNYGYGREYKIQNTKISWMDKKFIHNQTKRM